MNEAISTAVLRLLLIQSAAGAGLIVIMMVLRRMFRNKVSSRLIHFMWLVVALRMLVPVQLPTPVAMENKTLPVVLEAHFQEEIVNISASRESASAAAMAYAPQAAAEAANAAAAVKEVVPNTSFNDTNSLPPPRVPVGIIMLLVWLAGAVFMAAYTVIVNRRFKKCAMAGARELTLDTPIPVLLSSVPSPCLIGVLRPRILINPVGAQIENLPFVLRHELGHYRGLDHVWNLIGKIILALFWFHPLVWAAEHMRKRDSERACDERVTKALEPMETAAYARTLIALVSPERMRFAPAASMMASTLGDMKKRITRIVGGKQVRRWACALFAVLMLMTSAVSFATGGRNLPQTELPVEFDAMPAYCPIPGGLWIAFGGKLYKQAERDTLQEVAEASPDLIAAGEDDVYLLFKDNSEIRVLDQKGQPVKTWSLPKELYPAKLVTVGNKLAILSRLPEDENKGLIPQNGALHLMDTSTGNLDQVKLGNVIDISADGLGSLMVLHWPEGYGEAQVTRLNPNSLSAYPMASVGNDVFSIAAEAGTYYLLSDVGLVKYNEPSPISQKVMLPIMYPADRLMDMRLAGGMLYAWDSTSHRLMIKDVRETVPEGKITLTIVNRIGIGQAFDFARRAFEKKHPDVMVRDVVMNYDTAYSMMAFGDDAADIFCVGTYPLTDYSRLGYLMPLNEEPSIMDELHKAEWVPLEEHFSAGGKLYGVPVYVSYRLFEVDPVLAKRTGFEMPKPPYSWRDLYEAALKAELGQPGKPALMHDLSVNPTVIDRYTMAKANREGRVNYDTPAFREDMEAYKQMVNEKMIVLSDLYGYTASSMIFNITQEISANAVLPPAVDGQDSVEVSCYGFGINPNSKNKALAIEFLTEYVKPEHQYKTKYGETNAMLLKGASLYDHTAYGGPKAQENSGSWDGEELWRYAMDKWIYTDINLLMGNIISGTDVVKRYVEGSITLDEFIGILQYKADALQNR